VDDALADGARELDVDRVSPMLVQRLYGSRPPGCWSAELGGGSDRQLSLCKIRVTDTELLGVGSRPPPPAAGRSS